MCLKKSLTILFLTYFCLSIHAQSNTGYTYNKDTANLQQTQQSQKKYKKHQGHWSFGGNLGLSFWNGGTDILVAPKAYYHVTPQFISGFGLIYNYSKYDSGFNEYKYNSFGASVMGAVRPIEYLQLSAEYQPVKTKRQRNEFEDDYWLNSLFLGASFVTGNVAVGVQYDVLYDSGKSPYSSAWTPFVSFYF